MGDPAVGSPMVGSPLENSNGLLQLILSAAAKMTGLFSYELEYHEQILFEQTGTCQHESCPSCTYTTRNQLPLLCSKRWVLYK